jgi:xanthine/CO dehydrogenase XdhC/CoxF family maturation factor
MDDDGGVLMNAVSWRRAGRGVAIATVVATWGSAPRPVGSQMAVTDAGDWCGSVSGGCVEVAVIDEARATIASGVPRLLQYGVSDERAWEVGLPCGGRIEIYVEPIE